MGNNSRRPETIIIASASVHKPTRTVITEDCSGNMGGNSEQWLARLDLVSCITAFPTAKSFDQSALSKQDNVYLVVINILHF